MTEPTVSRRAALKLVAVTAVGGVLMSRAAFAQEAAATAAAESALMPGADVCVLTPETTEGPYYFDPALVRTDITEGQPGVATTVRLQVVDATCRPIEGARLDIWHCNAYGQYSGYRNQPGGADATGETFLRGTQFANAEGMVEFETIYPGWYPGRTTHIHFKVLPDERSALTGQIFFPDAVSEFIYRTAAPYSDRGPERAVLNGNDGIARRAGPASVASVTEGAERYLVAMIIGVDPGA